MVEIVRRIGLTLVATLVTITGLWAQTSNSFTERQLRQLNLRSERVAAQIAQTEQLQATEPNDSLAVVLHELRRQAQTIAQTIARLEAKQQEALTEATAPTETEEQQQEVDELVERLANPFKFAMMRYAIIEREIVAEFDTYRNLYDTARLSLTTYDEATCLADAKSARSAYNKAIEGLLASATVIADRSDHLFTSKSDILKRFADSLSMADDKAYFIEQGNSIEASLMEELRGKCTDPDVAMYPYRKAALMNLEVKITRRLWGDQKADSLVTLMAQIVPSEALFAPLDKPKWAEAKYGEVAIHKQNKYSGVGNIPRIKPPSQGEVYSYVLGNYASLPSINTFRKAAPLYTERRADGRTYVYAGLYPTAKSAQQGLETLRKAGFKQPTLVMWQNGLRRDDFVDRSAQATAPKAAMFRIEIRGANYGLSEAASAVIKENAPRKELSKFTTEVGAIVYTLGIFTKEAEADALAKAIGAADSTISVRVVKI